MEECIMETVGSEPRSASGSDFAINIELEKYGAEYYDKETRTLSLIGSTREENEQAYLDGFFALILDYSMDLVDLLDDNLILSSGEVSSEMLACYIKIIQINAVLLREIDGFEKVDVQGVGDDVWRVLGVGLEYEFGSLTETTRHLVKKKGKEALFRQSHNVLARIGSCKERQWLIETDDQHELEIVSPILYFMIPRAFGNDEIDEFLVSVGQIHKVWVKHIIDSVSLKGTVTFDKLVSELNKRAKCKISLIGSTTLSSTEEEKTKLSRGRKMMKAIKKAAVSSTEPELDDFGSGDLVIELANKKYSEYTTCDVQINYAFPLSNIAYIWSDVLNALVSTTAYKPRIDFAKYDVMGVYAPTLVTCMVNRDDKAIAGVDNQGFDFALICLKMQELESALLYRFYNQTYDRENEKPLMKWTGHKMSHCDGRRGTTRTTGSLSSVKERSEHWIRTGLECFILHYYLEYLKDEDNATIHRYVEDMKTMFDSCLESIVTTLSNEKYITLLNVDLEATKEQYQTNFHINVDQLEKTFTDTQNNVKAQSQAKVTYVKYLNDLNRNKEEIRIAKPCEDADGEIKPFQTGGRHDTYFDLEIIEGDIMVVVEKRTWKSLT